MSLFFAYLVEKLRLSGGGKSAAFTETAIKTEIQNKLEVDIDSILENQECVDLLVSTHQFTHDDLDHFAEILYHLSLLTNCKESKSNYILTIRSIYRYLDKNSNAFSFNRFQIEEELKNISDPQE